MEFNTESWIHRILFNVDLYRRKQIMLDRNQLQCIKQKYSSNIREKIKHIYDILCTKNSN